MLKEKCEKAFELSASLITPNKVLHGDAVAYKSVFNLLILHQISFNPFPIYDWLPKCQPRVANKQCVFLELNVEAPKWTVFSWCSRILFLIFASLKTERHLKSELERWSTSKNVKRKKWILWHADGICSRYFLLSTDNLIWIFIFLITKKLKWLSGYKKVNEIAVMCENRKKSRFFVYIACDVSVLPFFRLPN